MKPITRLKKRIGVSCGQVMDQNCCLGVAPSIDAASYIEPGIPFNPASHKIIPLPAAHDPIRISEGLAHASAFSQPGGARPSHWVKLKKSEASMGPSVNTRKPMAQGETNK